MCVCVRTRERTLYTWCVLIIAELRNLTHRSIIIPHDVSERLIPEFIIFIFHLKYFLGAILDIQLQSSNTM